ncbi:hypothetical protein BDN70DRAFT_937335 [Pholiota conissans]|uniref:JmjC domain-containing protein n=1 Tax=Pholiota conissans TaxID=109636 RepID=A0A9P5YR41_9AGAR|nr:hypothetical protein BDN70DRAFT_937335 [Pholiota conissans]
MARNLEAFLTELATSLDHEDLRILSLLGNQKAAVRVGHITEKVALNLGEKISNVMSHLRIIDFEMRRLNMGIEPLPIVVRNTMTEKQLGGERTARITDKLFNFRTCINEFVTLVNSIQQTSATSNPVPATAKKSVSHLHNLSYAHGKGKMEVIVNNFRAAAFHLSAIQELAKSPNTKILQENEEMKLFIEEAEGYLKTHGVAQQIVNGYVKSTGVPNVRLPLHLATLLSPITLLFGVDLTVSKVPRSTINSLSVAIGNGHPDVLAQLELEIWRTLMDITEDSSQSACWKAMINLRDSAPLKQIIDLDPLDSVFSFFKSYAMYSPAEVAGSSRIHEIEEEQPSPLRQMITGVEHGQRPVLNKPDVRMGSLPDGSGPDVDDDIADAHGDHDDEIQSTTKSSVSSRRPAQEDICRVLDAVSNPPAAPTITNATESGSTLSAAKPRSPVSPSNTVKDAINKALESNMEQEERLHGESSSNGENIAKLTPRRSGLPNASKPPRNTSKKPKKQAKSKNVSPPIVDEEGNEDIVFVAWNKVLDDFVVPDKNDLKVEDLAPIGATPPILSSDKTFTCWGARGKKFEFRPSAHYSETIDSICGIVGQMEAGYVNGKPPHLCENSDATSMFMIFNYEEYEGLQQNEVQHLLRCGKIIAITGLPSKRRTYKQAVKELAPLHQKTTIQDYTIPPHKLPTRQGTVQELIDAAEPEIHKILNGLSFPRPWAGMSVTSYASDTHALPHVMHGAGAIRRDLPIGEYRFGLVAPHDAWHAWHIDSDGFGTFIETVTGAKLWITASTIGTPDALAFSRIGFFFNKEFDLNKSGKGLFNVQAMVLEEDTKIIMGPGQLHAVYTLAPSVCHGGHFYATAALRRTLVSMIHGFICHQYITNTTHQHFRYLLAAMISFYHSALVLGQIEPSEFDEHHIPNPEDPVVLNDLLIACALGCMMNALSLDTYCANPEVNRDVMTKAEAAEWVKYDVNSMSDKDRRMCCLARGQAMQIVAWLDSSYKVTDPPSGRFSQIFSMLLINVCKTLMDYKFLADSQKISHHANLTFERLQHQVVGLLTFANRSYKCDPTTWKHPLYSLKHSILDCLTEIAVKRRPKSDFEPLSVMGLFDSGETALDKKYALRLNVKEDPVDTQLQKGEKSGDSNDNSNDPESEDELEGARPLKRIRQS